MIRRIAFNLFLFAAAFFLPWWLALLIATAGAFAFHCYYEAVVLGTVVDSLYNTPVAFYGGFEFVATVLMIVMLAGVESLKGRLKFYR